MLKEIIKPTHAATGWASRTGKQVLPRSAWNWALEDERRKYIVCQYGFDVVSRTL